MQCNLNVIFALHYEPVVPDPHVLNWHL